MAVESSENFGNATCPLCDDYSGPPSSVEAHISRMTDPVHQGEVGRAFRDHIQGRAELIEEPGADDQEEEVEEGQETVEVEPPSVESSESPGSDYSEESEESDDQEEVEVEPVDDASVESTESAGSDYSEKGEELALPLPEVETSTLIILGAVLLGASIIIMRTRGGSGSDQADEQADQEQSEDEENSEQADRGLIE